MRINYRGASRSVNDHRGASRSANDHRGASRSANDHRGASRFANGRPRGARWPLPLLAVALLVQRGGASEGVPGSDGVPPGAVAFFLSSGPCPTGWTAAPSATGRLVVGTQAGKNVGVQVGLPLSDQEDRQHRHAYYAKVTLPYKSISGADGGNDQAAAAGTVTLTDTSGAAPSGLPFIQLPVCEHP